MSRYALTTVCIVCTFWLAFLPSGELARKREQDHDGMLGCFNFLACECGGAIERKYLDECYELMKNKTKVWMINEMSSGEACMELKGKYILNRGVENTGKLCALPEVPRERCAKKFADDFKAYYLRLSKSIWPQDLEESIHIFQTFECLSPMFLWCNDFAQQCMTDQ